MDADIPDATITEDVEDRSLDDYDPAFLVHEDVLKGRVRLDSRRWLVLPDRYILRPLRALEAAKAADALTASTHGKALLAAGSRLLSIRQGFVAALVADPDTADLDPEEIEREVDMRMIDHVQLTLEDVVGQTRMEVYAWALAWCERCSLYRIPLPSRRDGPARDPGGLVHAAKGGGEWHTYYAGRQVHLLRLGAACAWLSLGPFFCDLGTYR